MDTVQNPSDDASRGLSLRKSGKVHRWLNGPKFLWKDEEEWSHPTQVPVVSELDSEVKVEKRVNASIVKEAESLLETLEKRISKWNHMKRTMAVAVMFTEKCKKIKDKG